MIEGVAQEVDVAALEGDFGQDFPDGGAKAGVIVGDDELDAIGAALAQAEKKVLPGRSAFAIGHVDRQDLAAPSQSTPMAISTAWLITTPPSRTFS